MRSAHAVAVGLRERRSLANGLATALEGADAAGAALIGAHPDDDVVTTSRSHPTLGFAADPDGLGALVHRFELFNRAQLFPWVAAAGRASVATGDFHRAEHLGGWKTLVPLRAREGAIVDYLRSPSARLPRALRHPEPVARLPELERSVAFAAAARS